MLIGALWLCRDPAQCAALSHHGPLSVYPFPRCISHRGSTFTHAVREVMTHLCSATANADCSFLQLSQPQAAAPHVRHRATQWSDALHAIADTHADLLMYVSPVELQRFCSSEHHTECQEMQSEHTDIIARGSTGACCDDATPGHPDPHHHRDPAHHAAQAAAERLASTHDEDMDSRFSESHDLEVRYFGMVSQSRDQLSSDGCYLIKTVQQRDKRACRCMHYALMRICKGSGLAEQAGRFWA